jgi:hypothetical protein
MENIRAELQDMQRRLGNGNLTPADMARLHELLNATRPHRLDAADVPLLRPNAPAAAPAAHCNIDFTRIPELITMGVDLSNELEQFTQEPFMPGQEYYRVTTRMNRRPYVYYFSIDALQDWLTANRCRHPILQNVSIAQRDIERFTYTGPPTAPIVPPIVVVGGRKFKKISKRLRQKSKRIKKSIRRRLRY